MIYTILVKIQNYIDLYTNFYVYTAYRQYMSGKLYWRYKKDGKWTWKPVKWLEMVSRTAGDFLACTAQEEEE